MAKELVRKKGSKRVAVLNMANSEDPEKRVTCGALEQEAYLMRCSDYYNALVQHKNDYPIDGEHAGIYTPGVTVFRDSDYHMSDEPWKVNVIAVSGLFRPSKKDEVEMLDFMLKFQNKIRTILRIAIAHGQTNLVLGAMGCGGLCNIPQAIAKMFHSVLFENEFSGAFEHIVFSMLPVEGRDETFDAFYSEFLVEDHFNEIQVDDANRNAEILQILRDEYTVPRFYVDGELNDDQFRNIILMIDRRELYEDSASNLTGRNLLATLFLFARKLRRGPCPEDLNLKYLILEQYEDDQHELDEDDQLILDDITNEFYDYVLTREVSPYSLYDFLFDDGYDELHIVIGYIYAIQKKMSDRKPNLIQD